MNLLSLSHHLKHVDVIRNMAIISSICHNVNRSHLAEFCLSINEILQLVFVVIIENLADFMAL